MATISERQVISAAVNTAEENKFAVTPSAAKGLSKVPARAQVRSTPSSNPNTTLGTPIRPANIAVRTGIVR